MPAESESIASLPPEAWRPLYKFFRFAKRPVDRFLQVEAASGILLLFAGCAAMIWANSPWFESYILLQSLPLRITIGEFSTERTGLWLINDALMVIFFFLVGLEIRRELSRGELAEWRRASLPVAAALGGMVIPALLFLSLATPEARSGWGIPMATDIAFALGVLSLLGKRVPPAMRVMLLALAVIDDLGAIVVIGLFYSGGLSPAGLLIAGFGLSLILVMQWSGIRRKILYIAPGLIIWAGIYSAGIHPTIAGVIIGLVTPVRTWEGEAVSPVDSLIEKLHPWVAFLIMPIFALANAGVVFDGVQFSNAPLSAASGVFLGLLIGKPLGVIGGTFLALGTGIARLPRGLQGRHILILGMTAGIGFTMSLFIAGLGFPDASMLAAAKAGVIAASAVSACATLVLGWMLLRHSDAGPGARSADEAEASNDL